MACILSLHRSMLGPHQYRTWHKHFKIWVPGRNAVEHAVPAVLQFISEELFEKMFSLIIWKNI